MRRALATLTAALAATGTAAQEEEAARPEPARFVVEAPGSAELGWGWSNTRAETVPTVCVVFARHRREMGQDAIVEVEEIEDSYALARAMDVSASVAVKGVVAEGSGKMSFAANSSVTASSISYLVTAEVMNAAEVAIPAVEDADEITGITLTPDARRMARWRPELFQDVCGDGFVSAMRSGARAYMLATTHTTSESQRSALRTSASGSGWGVKVSAAAGVSSSGQSDSLRRSMSFYQQGGSAAFDEEVEVTPATAARPAVTMRSGDLPSTAAEGIARIRKLAYAAAEAGEAFEMEVTPYEVLSNFPRDTDLMADERELLELAALWGSYDTLRDSLAAALRDPGQWLVPVRNAAGELSFAPPLGGGPANALLKRHHDVIREIGREIEAAAEACLAAEEDCSVDTEAFLSPYGVRASLPVPVDMPRLPVPEDAPEAETVVGAAWVERREAIQAALPQIDAATADALVYQDRADADALTGAYTRIYLEEPAAARCADGVGEPGCISYAEVAEWPAYRGYWPYRMPVPDPAPDPADEGAAGDDPRAALIAAAKAACGIATADVTYPVGTPTEPTAPLVWLPPAVSVLASGEVTCAGG